MRIFQTIYWSVRIFVAGVCLSIQLAWAMIVFDLKKKL